MSSERECAYGFWVMLCVVDGDKGAVLECVAGEGFDVALSAGEFAFGPVEEFEHEAFEIAEVVVEQAVNLAGYADILESFVLGRRRWVRLVLAGDAIEAVGGWRDLGGVAAEAGDLVGEQMQKALEHRVPAFARCD